MCIRDSSLNIARHHTGGVNQDNNYIHLRLPWTSGAYKMYHIQAQGYGLYAAPGLAGCLIDLSDAGPNPRVGCPGVWPDMALSTPFLLGRRLLFGRGLLGCRLLLCCRSYQPNHLLSSDRAKYVILHVV